MISNRNYIGIIGLANFLIFTVLFISISSIGIETAFTSSDDGSKVQIPDWIKKIGNFWISDQIDDNGFVQVIQWLIQQEIIVVPYAEEPEVSGSSQIPVWIKSTTEFWVNEQISDDEFSTALEWLINNGIIKVSNEEATEGNTIKVEIRDGVGAGDR